MLNGVTVPELNASSQRNWSYDATRNAVVFEARSLPAPGQNVGFDYTVSCMPMGGGTDGGVTAPCGPANCSGCCNASGQCVAGTSNSACGTLGAACAVCPLFCTATGCL